MATHRSRSGPTLVPVTVLLSIALAFVGLLYALFPERGPRELAQGRPDQLSITYLRLMLNSRPDDPELRLLLAEQLLALGRLEEAESVAALVPADALGGRGLLLALAIDRARWLAATGPEREQRRELLAERLWSAHPSGAEWAELAAALGEYRLAALVAQDLGTTPAERVRWQQRAAEWWQAAGDAAAAARLYAGLVAQTAPNEPAYHRRLLQAVRALIDAGDQGGANLILEQALLRTPHDGELWSKAVELALARGDTKGAAQYARRWWAAVPPSLRLARRLGKIYAAAGALDEALAMYRLAEPELNEEEQALYAQLAEWTGHPELAASVWLRRWRAHRRHRDEAELLRLARATYDDEVLLELFEWRLEVGRSLEEAELLDAVRRAEALGAPERALRLLDRQRARRPGQRAAGLAKARILTHLGRTAEALALAQEDCLRFGCDREQELERARQSWRLGQARTALEILQARRPAVDDQEHYELVAALAFTLEETEALAEALSALDALDADHAVRLVEALASLGRHEAATDAALKAYRRHRSSEALLAGLDAMLRVDRREDADRLVQAGLQDPDPVAGQSYFWMLKARLDLAQQRLLDYEADLLAIARLDPSADDAIAGIIWSRLDRDDRRGLEAALAQWQARGAERRGLWRPLAAAADRLGRAGEAARWYGRLYRAGVQDPALLLDYARALESTGEKVPAWRLRRYALLRLAEARAPETALARLVTAEQVGAHQEAARAQLELEARGAQAPEEAVALAERYFGAGRAEEGARALAAFPELSAARLAWALAEGDLEQVDRVLASEGPSLSAVSRAEAQLALGREEEALKTALEGWSVAGEEEAEALLATAEEVVRTRPNQVRAQAQLQQIGGLAIRALSARAEFSRADWNANLAASQLSLLDQGSETMFRLGARRYWKRGDSEAALGVVLDARGTPLWQATLQQRWRATRHLGLNLALGAGERVDDTEGLRTVAARERIELGVQYELGPRLSSAVSVAGARYRLRAGGALGRGLLLEGSTSYLLRAARPSLSLRIAANGALFDVAPEGAELLAPRFASAGLGARLGSGELGEVPSLAGGWRYQVDLFAGWLWPGNAPAYQLEAGFGHPLLGGDELGLRGRYGNALALDNSVRASAEVYYAFRFWP